MKITKHEQSLLTIVDGGATLVMDPGVFSGRLVDVENVEVIVLTHEHPDHWSAEHLTDLRSRFPQARVLGPAGVATAVADALGQDIVEVVAPGQRVDVAGFTLEFFGGTHALIHESIPKVDNVGVLVNGRLFHPGDSLEVPPIAVDILAVPMAAPWSKLGEVMDFVTAVKPSVGFGIHDALLSEAGMRMYEGRVQACLEAGGGSYVQVRPGDVIDR